MPRITEECVARIKDSIDIVELVGRYVQLRRAGASWKGCCPFHSEKTPSFHVNPARQAYHCFGCGEGGDGVKFLMRHEGLDYPTALRRLADMNGIPVVEEEENPELTRLRRLRTRIIEANELAARYYHNMLCRSREADHVRAYLKERGVNIDTAKAWQLGWAPPDFRPLHSMAESRGLHTDILTEAYLLGRGSSGAYPVFRDRLMFPIRNVRGEVVGFSGRVMQADKDPRKYVNTAETPAFRKGELLFGLYKATAAIAKSGMSVVICEGQLDVIACHEKADIRNAVAGLGTAFTEGHAKMLAKYAKKATLCYDGDRAGIAASEKTYRKLAQAGLEVYQAPLPPGEDPDSLIQNHGPEALRQAIAEARPYLELRANREIEFTRGDTNARAALIPRMADLAAEISDPMRREVAATDLATRLNVGLTSFRTTVEQIIKARKKAPTRPYNDAPPTYSEEEISAAPETPTAPVVPLALHPSIRNLVELAANNTTAQELLVDRIEELQEPIRHLDGGIILQRLLEALPPVGDAAAWQTFAHSLPPEQALALNTIALQPYTKEGMEHHIEQACTRAAQDAARAKLDILRAKMSDTTISHQEMHAYMDEFNHLQRLIALNTSPS